MKKLSVNQAAAINGGWTRCRICNQDVIGSWWYQFKHCLGHASRCLPWEAIMGLAFGIWL